MGCFDATKRQLDPVSRGLVAKLAKAGARDGRCPRLTKLLTSLPPHHSTWWSFVVAWVHPENLPGRARPIPEPRRERLRSFFRVAAALDRAPEGHDCAFHAWEGSDEDLARIARDHPHLGHVAEKIKRYRRRYRPPDELVDRVAAAADAFARKRKRGGALQLPTPKALDEALRARVDHILRVDGCHEDARTLERYCAENESKGAWCFEFDEASPLSRVDAAASAETWCFGKDKFFMLTASRDPRVFAHPLGRLLTDGKHGRHPLRSSLPDLLVRLT